MSNYYGLHTLVDDRDLSRMAAERSLLLQAVGKRRSQLRRRGLKSILARARSRNAAAVH